MKRLSIKEKPSYFLKNMTNIKDFDPGLLLINEIYIFKSESTMFELSYEGENNTHYAVFNNIECIFRKNGIESYLIFCESGKDKKMLNEYVKVIDEIKDQVLFITEANLFIMGRLFKRFRFKTVDDLPYDKKK